MDSATWDERYAAADLVWSVEPNQWVVELIGSLSPGKALDLAAGEGRNALWLVEQGWQVTAVDFSGVAVERMQQLAAARLGERASALTAVVGDATEPQGSGMDLVLLSYLHLPDEQWRRAVIAAVDACRPGGRLVIIGHARRNLTEGCGGPQDPAILRDPDDLRASLADLPVSIDSAEIRRRRVPTEAGTRIALDTVLVATVGTATGTGT